IGRAFAIRSALAIVGLAACLATIHYPDVTPDKLLTAVFGGFFIGAGIGLAMRGGAVLDGTDIAALLISKRSHLFRVGDVILGLNVVIFLAAATALGVESALYSILTYVSASKTLDFLLHGIEEYTAITIVSARSDAIRKAITGVLGRGVTVYKGRGGMTGADQDILFCVVTRLEIGKVMDLAEETDPAAFIVVYPLAEAQAGVLKKTAHDRSPGSRARCRALASAGARDGSTALRCRWFGPAVAGDDPGYDQLRRMHRRDMDRVPGHPGRVVG